MSTESPWHLKQCVICPWLIILNFSWSPTLRMANILAETFSNFFFWSQDPFALLEVIEDPQDAFVYVSYNFNL